MDEKSHIKILFPNNTCVVIEFTSYGKLQEDLWNTNTIRVSDPSFESISSDAQSELFIQFAMYAVPIDKEPHTIKISEYVYEKRKYGLAISTQELAKRASVSVACINRLEKGKTKNFDVNRLCNIANALEVDKDVLLYLAGVFESFKTSSDYVSYKMIGDEYNGGGFVENPKLDYKYNLEIALKRAKYPSQYINEVVNYAEYLYNKEKTLE